jgi:hypothetical protein
VIIGDQELPRFIPSHRLAQVLKAPGNRNSDFFSLLLPPTWPILAVCNFFPRLNKPSLTPLLYLLILPGFHVVYKNLEFLFINDYITVGFSPRSAPEKELRVCSTENNPAAKKKN